MQESAEVSLDPLMARLAEGDRSAFDPVFRALWGPTLRLCTSLVDNEADASDAAQSAMVKVLQRACDYDKKRPALPWALAIAAWECRTLNRWRWRRREQATDDQLTLSSAAEVEQDLVNRDLLRATVSSLGDLSELDRETLLATFWDEEGTTRGATFRKRRERALGRLRRSIRRLYGIDD